VRRFPEQSGDLLPQKPQDADGSIGRNDRACTLQIRWALIFIRNTGAGHTLVARDRSGLGGAAYGRQNAGRNRTLVGQRRLLVPETKA